MVGGVVVIALFAPSVLQREVRRNGDSKKTIGMFDKEGFSAAGQIWIKQFGACKARRDVGHNVRGDLDAELGAILGGVGLGQGKIHRVLESFQVIFVGLGEGVGQVPCVCCRKFRDSQSSVAVDGRSLIVLEPSGCPLKRWYRVVA